MAPGAKCHLTHLALSPGKLSRTTALGGAHQWLRSRSIAALVNRSNAVRTRLQRREIGARTDAGRNPGTTARGGEVFDAASPGRRPSHSSHTPRCSPQTHETRVVSHAGTETHTPNHLFSGTGLAAFLSSSPDPKSRKTIIASPARLADRLTRQRQRLLARGWIQAPAPFTPPRTAGSARATPTARAGGPRGVVDSNGCAAARPPARLG